MAESYYVTRVRLEFNVITKAENQTDAEWIPDRLTDEELLQHANGDVSRTYQVNSLFTIDQGLKFVGGHIESKPPTCHPTKATAIGK